MRRKGGAEYEDKHLAGAACDGSYHLPGAGIAADPAEKGDKKFIYPFLSLLCTLCKSFRNDIPRHIVGSRFLWSGLAGFTAAAVIAWVDGNLFRVSIGACMAVFLAELWL